MAKHELKRRKALKQLLAGIGSAGLLLHPRDLFSSVHKRLIRANRNLSTEGRTITAITLGAGNRGNVYGDYAVQYPDALNIVGVAEPIPIRRERYAQKHQIAGSKQFTTWEHVFEQPKFADAIIITTPDDLHFGPCMKALDMGYDILLEKPIAPTEKECRQILRKTQETGNIVAVCHVLRYAPYFVKLKELIDSGAIGKLISIQHFEPIEHIHMAHSFVRGNWHDSKKTTPIILAKSCHDLDILRWITGNPCTSIAAYGGLSWFKSENAPQGSTARCTDGCAVENECPYSALQIYYRDRKRTYVFDFPADESEHDAFLMEQLKTTDYGRCVYKMDNDQPDHYVTSMRFADGVTANFSMEAFTSYHGRRTRIMGSMGDIQGDMDTLVHNDFRTGKETRYAVEDIVAGNDALSGHGGGDWRLVDDWIAAVRASDPALLTSTIEASIDSHLMAFAAEKSRKNGVIARMKPLN